MTDLLRVSACAFPVTPLCPEKCADELIKTLETARENRPDLMVFPKDCLVGASSGSLVSSRAVKTAFDKAVKRVAETASGDEFITLLPLDGQNGIIRDGKLERMENPSMFYCRGFRCLFYTGSLADIVGLPNVSDADVLIISDAMAITAGKIAECRQAAKVLSGLYHSSIVLCNGSDGESSAPDLYKSFLGVYENGEEEVFSEEETAVVYDIDADVMGRGAANTTAKQTLFRNIRKNPFLPKENPEAYLDELFDLQVRSLAARMKNTGINRLVLGVSGGLDSTLAILVCVSALDLLDINRANLEAVTLPGMGTSDKTYRNAKKLIEAFGASGREISIKESVLQHFADIGHDASDRSVVYENAQARERTQILFDIANEVGGIVVGTGDLSEAALGFCTFNGDHMAGFNVNASITKTNARLLTLRLCENDRFKGVREVLMDILNTAVSPELLPPDAAGNISQSTEEILGPYALHEFYLYYFVKYNMAPSKIYAYAKTAFPEYDGEFIYETLARFIKRFISSQFKRAVSPEAAVITAFTLDVSKFRFPADGKADCFLRELETING